MIEYIEEKSMKTEDYEFQLDELGNPDDWIIFYEDTKFHVWDIITEKGKVSFTDAKGKAIIKFLKYLRGDPDWREEPE
jgi:hypothetical protein